MIRSIIGAPEFLGVVYGPLRQGTRRAAGATRTGVWFTSNIPGRTCVHSTSTDSTALDGEALSLMMRSYNKRTDPTYKAFETKSTRQIN